jgi:integrase
VKIIIGKHEATIYPEGNGYTGAISLGFDVTGRRWRVKRKGRTKAEVKDKLREVVADLEAGVSAAASYTVQEAVADFLDLGMKGKSPGTVANYRSIADHHLIPFIGAANLKKLTADELDTWLDDRAEELSTRTLRLVHQILERAIRHAQARDKVRRNVASLVSLPEGREGRPSRAMTLDQAVSVLDHVGPGSQHRLAAYVVVSLLAGIRTEEARALTWAEVDLDAGTVAVYRSVRAKGDTKTRKGRRVLKLPKRAVESLKEHRTRQAAERLRAGSAWQDHGLVFSREDGTPLDRWQVRREFAAITKAAGLGGVGTTRATALVRVHPQRPRRPHRGHQRLGGPQRHHGHRDRLPARDQARAHHRRHGHGPDPHPEANPGPASHGRDSNTPADPHAAACGTACRPPGNTGQAAAQEARLASRPITNTWLCGSVALRWLPDWLLKIEKGSECEPGTPSDLDLLVGTAGFEPATP